MGDIDKQGNELETEKTYNQTTQSNWGLLPIILEVCKETNHSLSDVYDFPITLTLYISTYIIEVQERKALELKKIKLK